MTLFWKSAAGILIAAVLVLTVRRQEKDMALLLTMTTCVMAVMTALSFMEPVIAFLYRLEELGDLQEGILESLLKIAGIGIISELAGMICLDSENASLGQAVKLLGVSVVMYLSIPIYEALLDVIQSILGEL